MAEYLAAHRWKLVGGLVLLFVVRLLLALSLVPPWQQPDEPAHVATARILSQGGVLALPRTPERDIEGAIIASMARYEWWHFYERPTPVPLPRSFEEIQSAESAVVHGSRLYYDGAARLIRFLRADSVEAQLYALRASSAVLAVFTLLAVYRAATIAVGPVEALAPLALLALHPQFVLNSTAASPDSAVNLFGAVVWWQALRVVTRRTAALSTVAMFGAALAAAVIRRGGAPLMFAALWPWVYARWQVRRDPTTRRRLLLVGAGCLLLAAIAIGSGALGQWLDRTQVSLNQLVRNPPAATFGNELWFAAVYASAGVAGVLERTPEWGFFPVFSKVLFDSSWLVAGWMRYPAPAWWLWTMHGFALLGFAGLLLRRARANCPPGVLVTTVMMFLVQIIAVYVLYFPAGVGPQGRYLFPVIGCAATLLWTGWRGWVPEKWRVASVIVWVALLAVMDGLAWTTVLFPLYWR